MQMHFRPWLNKNDALQISKTESRNSIPCKTDYCASKSMKIEPNEVTSVESLQSDVESIDCTSSNSADTCINLTCSSNNSADNNTNLSCSYNKSEDSGINLTFDDCESDIPSSFPQTISHKIPDPPPMPRADGQLKCCTSNMYAGCAQTSNVDKIQQHFPNQSYDQSHLPQNYNHQFTLFSGITPEIAASNSFYYAAAAANNLNFPQPLPLMPPNLSIDPNYSLGIMEQEYARVMAEEAQVKAFNARKQRPKKFKCPHCEVAFSNNGQLKGHIRIHTGERPFKCDAEGCGKTFTRNEELTRHKRIHTGIRPFPCAMCGKKFGRRDHLKKHMKTHLPQEHPLSNSVATFYMPFTLPSLYRI